MKLVSSIDNIMTLTISNLTSEINSKDLPELFELIAQYNIDFDTVVLYAIEEETIITMLDYLKKHNKFVNLIVLMPYEDSSHIAYPLHSFIVNNKTKDGQALRVRSSLIKNLALNKYVLTIAHITVHDAPSPIKGSYEFKDADELDKSFKDEFVKDLRKTIKDIVIDININLIYSPHHKVIKLVSEVDKQV